MTCERTKQREPHLQPYAGKRSLRERHAFRQAPDAVPFSAVKVSIFLIIATIIVTHNALANAKSVNRHLRNPLFLSQLRGGESSAANISSGGSQPQLNDEELDDYIDFLLAYADDQANEADNPLFRGESPLPEDIEEDTVVEEDNSVDTQESSETNDAALEPLVDDVNDDTQIDTVVEALVASIDDEDLENETPVEGLDNATNTIRIPEAAEAIETAEEHIHEAIIVQKELDESDLQEVEMEVEKAIGKDVEEATLETPIGEPVIDMQGEEPAEEVEVESETFYLGSSAVEDMPLPVNEGNYSVGPATDAMLAKEGLDGETVEHTAEITTEPTKRVTLFTSFMKKIGLKKEDSEGADAIIVDPDEPIEETIDSEEDVDLEKVTEVVLDSSGAAEETAITVSGSGSQSHIVLELGESNVQEEKVEGEISERKVEDIADAVVVDEVVDQATKASIVSSVQQYYQGSLGSIKKIWSKKRWYIRRGTKAIDAPPERDYTKIYEKYFAANNQIPDVNESSTQELSKRLRSSFLKPWGTVTKYFTPKELHDNEDSEKSHIDDYSIGIKPFLTEDLSRATAFQANADDNEPVETEGGFDQAGTNVGSEIGTTFVEGSGRAEFTIAVDDYREDIHIERTSSATEDLNVMISIEKTTVDAEVDELNEDAPDEAGIATDIEVVSQEDLEDAEFVLESQGVEIVTESAEVEALSEDVEPSLAVEVGSDVVAEVTEQVDSMKVIEDAEVTEVEADSTEVAEDAGTVTEEEAELDKEEVIEDSEVDTEVTEEVHKEQLVKDADTVTRVTEEDAQEDSKIITELTEVEDDSVEVIEDTEIITEVTKVEVDIVEVVEDTEIVTEITEVEVDEEEAILDSEVLTGNTEVEVDSEDTPEDADSIKRGTEDVDSDNVQENAENATGIIEEGEDVQENAEVVTELIKERVDIDIDPEESEVVTEVIERDSDIKEVTEVEIDNFEVLEAVTECSKEVDTEETPESSIEDAEQYKSEDVPEDIKVERNGNQVPEGIEIVTEVMEEVDSEEVPEDAEVVIEVNEVEVDSIETQEDTEIITERAEVEVEKEILINTEKTLPEADESTNPSADISAKVPRRSNVFTRLWGTRKALNTFDNVKVDIEVTGIAAEETVLEADNSIDDQKTTSEDRPHQPNTFIRLWGTVKEPKEPYSLGLQGVRGINDSKLWEDSREISDNDAVESLEVVDDTNVLDDEVNDFEIIGERVPFGSASVEGKQSERNVLQLHSPEREEKEDRRGLLENASVEVPNIISSSEDSIENGKITTLQLDKEIAVTISDSIGDVDETEIEVDYYPNDSEEEFLNESVDNMVSEADENSLDEADEEENAMEFGVVDADQYIFTDEDSIDEADEEENASEFGVVDANQYISSDDEDSFEEIDKEHDAKEFRVADDDQYIASEEDKHFVENSDEEDVEVSIVTDADDFIDEVDEEDLESLFVEEHVKDEYSFQQGDKEEFVEEEVSVKTYEQEEILDELEIPQPDEEEIEGYANEINEKESLISEGMGSAPYSLEVEMQNANFLTRFLLKKSMGQVIMITIVITEWFRLYILAPFLESIEWIKDGKGQDLFQTLINMRGGSLASPLINIRGGALASLSESEDVDQAIEVEEIEKGGEEEEVTVEHQCVNLNDTDKSDTDSLKDSHEGGSGQINSTDSEKSTAEMHLLSSPALRPNFVFRRLLNYGFFGHVVIMEMILASEWFNLYVPQIRSMYSFIMHDLIKYKKKHGRRPGEPDNYWDSGFVNIGEGSRLPKKSRKQMKKADQKALYDLESVGNASEAKYRFISQNFMKRHGLGPYRVAVSEIELDLESSKEGLESNNNRRIEEEDEADSDSGWILDALGVEEDKESSLSSAPFDTSVGVSISSGVPKVSVGLSMNLGKKKGKRISSQKLRSAIVGNESTEISSKRKNSSKPHVSDSESGIMGRLRAQGANSLVGRNILGAYPGDLPPPDEAADPKGVIDMAQRYGYGDWSDEDDEADEFAFGAFESEKSNNEDDCLADDDELRPKKRSRRTRTKKHRSSSSRKQQSVGVEFDFDLGSSSQESVSLSNVSARRKSTGLSSSSGSTSYSGSRRRRRSRSSPHSPAMEELGGSPRSRSASSKKTSKTANRTISSTNTKIKDILTDSAARTRKRKTKTLRPAMSNLDEKNANEDQ